MITVALISMKGGSGKTTIALNLAVAASFQKKTAAIIDLDPQGSVLCWWRHRKACMGVHEPKVESTYAVGLQEVFENVSGSDYVFIDTASHNMSEAISAAKVADVVLIPFMPSAPDLAEIHSSFEVAKAAKKKAAAIMNMAPTRGTLGQEVLEWMELRNYAVSPVVLAQRNTFLRSIFEGMSVQEYEPNGKASEEIRNLFMWMDLFRWMLEFHKQ